ncbi:hypothetical protein SERLADRAFT_462579 [Serpula lacrymans var. lacrymans S7.9]|uniref:Uncharacterized protein n=1 Tax=Serpula lacrymans var. lacrymans (strain S7.9) TaxID=578457 RepID=F8NNY8_SERL9|nr:uncharacterized protein SERLADRAFT_462579 [Serpula lacrymans var. lacrymans S7.9]EGO28087.1 hypothetical protein SERLADRAFT_462579 [Serpula lacrymans var. lacrymans S7.9]
MGDLPEDVGLHWVCLLGWVRLGWLQAVEEVLVVATRQHALAVRLPVYARSVVGVCDCVKHLPQIWQHWYQWKAWMMEHAKILPDNERWTIT